MPCIITQQLIIYFNKIKPYTITLLSFPVSQLFFSLISISQPWHTLTHDYKTHTNTNTNTIIHTRTRTPCSFSPLPLLSKSLTSHLLHLFSPVLPLLTDTAPCKQTPQLIHHLSAPLYIHMNTPLNQTRTPKKHQACTYYVSLSISYSAPSIPSHTTHTIPPNYSSLSPLIFTISTHPHTRWQTYEHTPDPDITHTPCTTFLNLLPYSPLITTAREHTNTHTVKHTHAHTTLT